MSSHSSSHSGSGLDSSDGGETPELESPESRPVSDNDEEDDDDYVQDEDANEEEDDEDEDEGHLDSDDDLFIPPAYGNSHLLPVTADLVTDNRTITLYR